MAPRSVFVLRLGAGGNFRRGDRESAAPSPSVNLLENAATPSVRSNLGLQCVAMFDYLPVRVGAGGVGVGPGAATRVGFRNSLNIRNTQPGK